MPAIRLFLLGSLLVSMVVVSRGLAAENTAPPGLPTPAQIIHSVVKGGEGLWHSVNDPAGKFTSREVFSYALGLCEAQSNPDRLERLFEAAARVQDRDPKSNTYGNFRWSSNHEAVFDWNAVDFCMQGGALIWLRHCDSLPPAAKEKLRQILELAGQGLLNHHVTESYTNIALMNAGDLILLGEAMEKPEWANEGYARLDRFCLYTWEGGIHEYCSPTYYSTDLDDLVLIEAFSKREKARLQARALLELLWTDIALNWFAPAVKLAGACSRDYDYLHGLGYLDQQMMANGWLATDEKHHISAIWPAFATWWPPARLKELCETKYPRLVTQIWGLDKNQSRTHFVNRDVTLGSAGAAYGGWMDLPLCVTLPGPREGVRCYFIPDGRHDPYGKIKIPNGKAHQKTLHLQPFWVAAQRRGDALGLAMYRDKDLAEDFKTLESHFVLPLALDGFWIGERRIEFKPGTAAEYPLAAGDSLVVRQGSAAVGVRVPWAVDLAGKSATVSLVYDANDFGAVRLTVTHHLTAGGNRHGNAGAAFWVRVGSGISSDEAFGKWRQQFAASTPEVSSAEGSVRGSVPGENGPVTVAAAAPFTKPQQLEPAPLRAILGCNGDDIGRRLLMEIEPIKTYLAKKGTASTVVVQPDKDVYWDAESGQVMPPMVIGEDPKASRGFFVWMPAKPGERASSSIGNVTWELKIAKAGRYYLWGHVQAPTSDNDSFLFRVFSEDSEWIPATAWPVGVHKKWDWVRITLENEKAPQGIELPQGKLNLQLRVREAGTAIDRLFITSEAATEPK